MDRKIGLSGEETTVLVMLRKPGPLSDFRSWAAFNLGKSESDTQRLLDAMQRQGLVKIKDGQISKVPES